MQYVLSCVTEDEGIGIIVSIIDGMVSTSR